MKQKPPAFNLPSVLISLCMNCIVHKKSTTLKTIKSKRLENDIEFQTSSAARYPDVIAMWENKCFPRAFACTIGDPRDIIGLCLQSGKCQSTRISRNSKSVKVSTQNMLTENKQDMWEGRQIVKKNFTRGNMFFLNTILLSLHDGED